MIKGDFLEHIIDVFEKHERFEYVDFKIDIDKDTLNITYVIEPKFYITFKDKNHFKQDSIDLSFEIVGEACPGKFSIKEDFVLTNKQAIYNKIDSWLNVVWNEISMTMSLTLLNEEHKQIDKICGKFNSMEGYFTTEEVIEIKKELKKLRDDFAEGLNHLMLQDEIYNIEMSKLHKDFETLEKTAPFLKKKGWIRSLTGRVFHNSRRLLYLHQKNILDNID